MTLSNATKYKIKLSLFFSSIAILIVVSLTSLWLSRVIFNTERFTAIAVDAYSKPSSRDSIGDLVANRVFEKTPMLKTVLSDKLSLYVSNILNSETAKNSIETLAREGQLLFTSPRQVPLVLDLREVKPFITTAQELIGRSDEERRINVDDIPDTILIIDTEKLPNLYTISQIVYVTGPLSFMAAFLLSFYWIRRGGKNNIFARLRMVLLVAIGSAVIALFIGPLFEPTFISVGRNAPSQTLLSNLYEAFITPFSHQAYWFGGVALLALLFTTAYDEFSKRYSILIRLTKKK